MQDKAQQKKWDAQVLNMRNEPEPWGKFVRAMLDGTLCSYLDDGSISKMRDRWIDVYIVGVQQGIGGNVEVIRSGDAALPRRYPTKVTDLSRIRIP